MARKQIDRNSEPETLWTRLFGAETGRNKQPNQAVSTDDQDAIRQYLLGQLTPDQQREVEGRLLTEDDFFEELEIAEDELIDERLAGKLTETERAGFEQSFLAAPERQENLRFSRILGRHISLPPPAPPLLLPWWNNQSYLLRAAAAVAAVVIVVGILIPATWIYRTRTKPPQTFADLTLLITTTTNRAAGVQATKVRLPLNADALRIALRLPDSSAPVAGYRVELVNDNGEKTPLEMAAQGAQAVSVVIPAAQLERGQYALKLFAISTTGAEQPINGNYFFTVE